MHRSRLFAWLSAALVGCLVPAVADAQSATTFTYQGSLGSSGSSITGAADFRFRLYDAPVDGNQVGLQFGTLGTAVNKGVFTVLIDFGPVFASGAPLWLEIDVRSPAGSGAFTTLSPRQAITPAPLAQGIVGVPLTPAGATALDQDQSQGNAGGQSVWFPFQSWQSFTAGSTGTLTKVQVNETSAANLMVNVYEGVGLGGQQIGHSAAPGNLGIVDVAFSNITLIAGQKYTLWFETNTASGALQTVTQQIPGAAGSYAGSTPVNWWFRTFMTPKAQIDAASAVALTVPWSGVQDVPPNVSAAPWGSVGSGIAYTGGAVGIGTSSPEGGLSVTAYKQSLSPQQPGVHLGREVSPYNSSTGIEIVADAGGSPVIDFSTLPTSADFGARLRYDSATDTLYLDGANWCANAFCPSSSQLKENVAPITGALESISHLQGVQFDWKPGEVSKHNTAHDFGFIAEDVEKVFPEVVVKDKDGKVLGMDYARLTSVAVEAIKQLRGENDAVKQENAELKARLDRIEAMFTQLQATGTQGAHR